MKNIISASADKTIKIWNFSLGRKAFTLHGHIESVETVAISNDRLFIVSGPSDTKIKLWNFEERREECTLEGHKMTVNSVAITEDQRYIISGSDDKTIKNPKYPIKRIIWIIKYKYFRLKTKAAILWWYIM